MGLGLAAQPQQPHHVGVVQLAEHLRLAPEVQLQLLVPRLQALHQHQRLALAVLRSLRLGQEDFAKLPPACRGTGEEDSKLGERIWEARRLQDPPSPQPVEISGWEVYSQEFLAENRGPAYPG